MSDLLGIKRPQLYAALLNSMRDKLEHFIRSSNETSNENLEKLLDASFPYIRFPELKAIPIAVLQKIPKIPTRFIKVLKENQDIFTSLPIEVKRQIWEVDIELFRKHV